MCNSTSQTIVKIYNPLQVLLTDACNECIWTRSTWKYTLRLTQWCIWWWHNTTIHFTCRCIKIDQSDCKHIFWDAKIYNNKNNKLFIETNLIVCKYKSTIAGQQKHGTLGCTPNPTCLKVIDSLQAHWLVCYHSLNIL